MARPKTPTLTAAELKLMDVLWSQGPATVTEVRDALSGRNHPAYNTVLTTLRILEAKGCVSHSKRGRAHVFQPLISRNQARGQALRHVVRSFFAGSPALLVRSLLEHEDLSPEDMAELKRMIRKAERIP